MITDNINFCDIDIKKELYSNLLLTGGNILFSNNMQQRLCDRRDRTEIKNN